MILLSSVLVATDFSDTSQAVLEYGRNLARAFGATLHVLHVAVPLAPMSAADFAPVGLNIAEEDMEDTRRQLDLQLSDSDRAQLRAKPIVQTSSSPADAIINYARTTHVDVIVVGTHGRGGLAHLLMGSVAEHVVRNAPCPVLVVRPNEHEFILPDPVGVSARI